MFRVPSLALRPRAANTRRRLRVAPVVIGSASEALTGSFDATADLDTRRAMVAAARARFEATRFRLRFPPVLEACYERDTGPRRCEASARYGLIGLVLCNLCLLNYFTLLPDVAWRALFMQLGVFTPATILGLAYTWTNPPAFRREVSQVFNALLGLVIAIVVYGASAFPAAVFFRYCPILTALFVNVVLNVRFRLAALTTVVTVVCSIADLWSYTGANSDIKGMIASSILVVCAFTLLANHRLDREQRRTYLLNAREQLLREDAARLDAQQAEEALRRAKEREQAALAAAAMAAELRNAHRIARLGTWRRDLANGAIAISDELHALLGTDPATTNLTRGTVLALVHPEDRAAFAHTLTRVASGQSEEREVEFRVVRPDGGLSWFWAATRLERDDGERALAVRGICQDVTERRVAAERIYKLAHHDALTGLANRALLGQRLADGIASARRTGSGLAVFCLDLDGFKAINDLHGHGAGDRLLQEVGARLSRSIRETDTAARLGGDEFVVVQTGSDQPEAARTLAERLVAALAEPIDLDGGSTQGLVTTSVGIALFPDDGDDPETLLRNADTALYRAKWAGKNGFAFFQPGMDHELRERRALESDLRQAAARGEFSLAWQPLATAGKDSTVGGFEVLLRWHHPERGLLMPDLFIPLAESCGAIHAIGASVMQEACREAARWAVPLEVAVNISPLQVQRGATFAEMVENALECSGLAPSRLVLEVTERILIRDADEALATLHRLKALGVRVALDDFGTGSSSLAILRAFPFDKLKIDRSFVSGLTREAGSQDAAIVEAVLGLARSLHLPVVAKGVETEAQLRVLQVAGCGEMQGWLLGRPAPIGSFAHLTGTRKAAA